MRSLSARHMMPRVTVLMAVYNGLPYLRQAIESVLAQSFADFELLVIDDASSDGSAECVRSYDDPRIRLICNERNLGQTPSLNRGLELARGEYVARLDQDDLCAPERLEKQVALLDTRPDVAVVASWARLIDNGGQPAGLWRGTIDDFPDFFSTLLLGNCPFVHSSVMMRRDAVVEVGGYDPAFKRMQDYELWTRLALRRYGGLILQEPLVFYRVHDRQQHVTKASAIERDYRIAHERLIGRLSGGRHAELLVELLRADQEFWARCQTREEVAAVLRTLYELLMSARDSLKLSRHEAAQVAFPIYRRLAGFARMGIARGHTQSSELVRFALQGGLRIACSPSLLLYAALRVARPFVGQRLLQILGEPSLRKLLEGRRWR